MDRVPRFKLRGSRPVDAETGLLWQIAGSGSIWFEGVGRMFAVAQIKISKINAQGFNQIWEIGYTVDDMVSPSITELSSGGVI